MRAAVAVAMAAVLALLLACEGPDDSARTADPAEALAGAVSSDDLWDTLVALQALADAHEGRRDAAETREMARATLGSASDHVSFAAAGVPVLWLWAGAGTKSEAQAARWGGVAGEPMDPCYHQACDDLDNIDLALLTDLTRAAGWVVGRMAGTSCD